MSLSGGLVPLEFKNEDIIKIIHDGYVDAAAIITQYGLDGNYDDVIRDWVKEWTGINNFNKTLIKIKCVHRVLRFPSAVE